MANTRKRGASREWKIVVDGGTKDQTDATRMQPIEAHAEMKALLDHNTINAYVISTMIPDVVFVGSTSGWNLYYGQSREQEVIAAARALSGVSFVAQGCGRTNPYCPCDTCKLHRAPKEPPSK
jgi:hypothetical protein